MNRSRAFREIITQDWMPNITVAIRKLDDTTLNYRERFVIGERLSGVTLQDIGLLLKLSRERISQIERKALRKLRHPPNWGKPPVQKENT